jgi:hypothetical protein
MQNECSSCLCRDVGLYKIGRLRWDRKVVKALASDSAAMAGSPRTAEGCIPLLGTDAWTPLISELVGGSAHLFEPFIKLLVIMHRPVSYDVFRLARLLKAFHC